jgi:phosphoenolpyruvate-protein kinase (PTS system EI component)
MTRTELLDFVTQTLRRSRAELSAEGLDFAPQVPLGVMIETAAAAPLVPLWAEQVAFFALGTNDLTASALGVDREGPAGAAQADHLHPGLLRLIGRVVDDAHAAGRPVSVCGEMAADPLGGLALAALGVDSLSVPVNQYAAARQARGGLTAAALEGLAERLLRQRTAADVRSLLREWRAGALVVGW